MQDTLDNWKTQIKKGYLELKDGFQQARQWVSDKIAQGYFICLTRSVGDAVHTARGARRGGRRAEASAPEPAAGPERLGLLYPGGPVDLGHFRQCTVDLICIIARDVLSVSTLSKPS